MPAFRTTRPGFIPFPAQSQDNIPSLDQFTQEVRIASNNSGGLGYQAGIFYFNENLDIETFDFGSADRRPARDAIVDQRQDSEALGIFGSVNYKFDSGLTLQAGARWNTTSENEAASPTAVRYSGPASSVRRPGPGDARPRSTTAC